MNKKKIARQRNSKRTIIVKRESERDELASLNVINSMTNEEAIDFLYQLGFILVPKKDGTDPLTMTSRPSCHTL